MSFSLAKVVRFQRNMWRRRNRTVGSELQDSCTLKTAGYPAVARPGLTCKQQVGTWLSLVERTLGVGEVASSNLVVPTIYFAKQFQPLTSEPICVFRTRPDRDETSAIHGVSEKRTFQGIVFGISC
jgi:hypothetical protein